MLTCKNVTYRFSKHSILRINIPATAILLPLCLYFSWVAVQPECSVIPLLVISLHDQAAYSTLHRFVLPIASAWEQFLPSCCLLLHYQLTPKLQQTGIQELQLSKRELLIQLCQHNDLF